MKFTINLPLYDMFRATPDSMEMGDIVASLSLTNKDYVSLRMKDSATINKRIVADAINRLSVDHENKKFYLFLSTQGCTTKRKSLLELLSVLLPSIAAITSYLPFEEIILVPLNYTVQKEYELSELSSNTLDKLVTLDVQFKHFKTATIDTMFNVPAISSDIAISDNFITEFEDLAVTPRFELYGSTSKGQSIGLSFSSFITAAKEVLGANLVSLDIHETVPDLLTVLDGVNSESLIALHFTDVHYTQISSVLGALILDANKRYKAARTFRIVVFGHKISTALTDLHLSFNSRKDCNVHTRFDFSVEDLIQLANTISTNPIETTYFNPVKIEEKPDMYNQFSKRKINLLSTADAGIQAAHVMTHVNQLLGVLKWYPLGINRIANTGCWVSEATLDKTGWLLVEIQQCALTQTTRIVDAAIRLYYEIHHSPMRTLNIIVTGEQGAPTAHHFSHIDQAQFLLGDGSFNVMQHLFDINRFTANSPYPTIPHQQIKEQSTPGTSFNRVNAMKFSQNYNIHPEQPEWDINLFQPSVQLITSKLHNGNYSIFGHEMMVTPVTDFNEVLEVKTPSQLEMHYVFGSPTKRKVIKPTVLVLPVALDKVMATAVPVIIKLQDKHYVYQLVGDGEDSNEAWITLIEIDAERDLETIPQCNLDSVNMF